MDGPYAKQREAFIDSVKALEEEIKNIPEGDSTPGATLRSAQEQLDALAKKYQNDEKLGSARYKLYELQAFIYFFEQKNAKALEFITFAIESKGGSYPKAEKLIEQLSLPQAAHERVTGDETKMTKAQKRKKLIGLEGWLAFFIFGQFLALLLTVINFFSDGMTSSSDIEILNQYESGLGDSFLALITFENCAIFLYVALIITTVVLLFRRMKIAKWFAITTLAFAALYGMIDYAVASTLFSGEIFQSAEMQSFLSKYAGEVARTVLVACVWIPYFFVSKRVKATLTK